MIKVGGWISNVFAAVCGLIGAVPSQGETISEFMSASDALRGLEEAYKQGDIEKAVAAKDFVEEARVMLGDLAPPIGTMESALIEWAEILELSFRKDIRENGFPDFISSDCKITREEIRNNGIVALFETCKFRGGVVSSQVLIAKHTTAGWRIIGLEAQPQSDL